MGCGDPWTRGGEPGHALGDIAFNGAGDGCRWNVPSIKGKGNNYENDPDNETKYNSSLNFLWLFKKSSEHN